MAARIWFAGDGESATQKATEALVRRGFRVVRSFDLRSAVAGHHECACPHHGTEHCTCQYVVLLAYGPAAAPVVITAHGRDTDAELQIVDDPNVPRDAATSGIVWAALAEAALAADARLAAAKPLAGAEVDAC